MKRLLFLIILVLFISFPIFSETVILNTPYNKEISIDIPNNPDDRKDLIIQISELYWGERYDNEACDKDLTDSVQQVDDLVVELESTVAQLRESNNMIIILEEKLKEKVKNDPFRWGVNILGGGVVKDNLISLSFKANPYIQLFEFINIGAYFEYPIGIGLSIGVQFK